MRDRMKDIHLSLNAYLPLLAYFIFGLMKQLESPIENTLVEMQCATIVNINIILNRIMLIVTMHCSNLILPIKTLQFTFVLFSLDSEVYCHEELWQKFGNISCIILRLMSENCAYVMQNVCAKCKIR